ncbi:MAG: zinc ribbon domain-containing protein [Candidatus Zixiibacteriota bacterium]
MPTYQYRCTDCGYEFEEFQRISDDPIKTCPQCEGYPERLISGGIGFVLKGSGFYSTDHRTDSYKAGEVKEKNGTTASPSEKKDSTKNKKESDK